MVNEPIPAPTSASVRVEYADGTSREFHIHKPLRVEVDMPMPDRLPDIHADLGVVPPGITPPTLPRLDIRMQAGLSAEHQVITMDSREEDPALMTGRLLSLLSEAFDLRTDWDSADPEFAPRWRNWERVAGMLLRGELRR